MSLLYTSANGNMSTIPEGLFSSGSSEQNNIVKAGIELAVLAVNKGLYKDAIIQLEFILQMGIIKSETEEEYFVKEKIASLHHKLREFTKASQIYQEIYEKKLLKLGNSSKKVLELKSYISFLECKEGFPINSYYHLKEVLKKQEEQFGPKDKDAILTKCLMVVPMLQLKKYQKAVALCKYLLTESFLDDLEKSQVKINLAYGLMDLGDFQAAENNFYEVHYSLKMILGMGHPDTLRPLSRVALVLQLDSKLQDADKMYNHVWKLQKDIIGQSHPDTLWTNMNYGWLLFSCREYKRHIRVHMKVLNILQSLGQSDDKLIKVMITVSQMIMKNFPLVYLVKPISSMWQHEETYLSVIIEIQKLLLDGNLEKLNTFFDNDFKITEE